jgi:hypothetical protein
MKVALVCIAKNEENYIKEWVEYHTKLGFDNIFIYQNDWRCEYEHPKLIKIPFDGLSQQMNAYNDWLCKKRNDFQFVAFFDVDEFLVLKKHNTIQEFLSNYTDKNGVAINWYFFGNNGHDKVIDGEYSQLKRFTKREEKMNFHIKTILNCKVNSRMSVHNPDYVPLVSPEGISFIGPYNKKSSDEIAQLNHYFCKTPEEFLKKCERGRADVTQYKNTYETNYSPSNKNEVEDLHALNFMYGEKNYKQ